MFGFFKKKRLRPDALEDRPVTAESRARGLLPTLVTGQDLVLCKAGPQVRNTREVRLALFMAKTGSKRFVLVVNTDAIVEESVLALLGAQGGELRRTEVASHSIYVGCLHGDGSENGWVLGDETSLATLRESLKSVWLRDKLQLGAIIPFRELLQFGNEMWEENPDLRNVDGENVKEALLELMVEALKSDGSLFIQ